MFEQIKTTLYLLIILAVVGIIGFWAITSLQSGSEFKLKEEVQSLKTENDDLRKEISAMSDELAMLRPYKEEAPAPEPEPTIEEPATPTTYKNQTLINELEKLIKDGVYMKLGSKGTRVGTVQKFLNLYNNKKSTVDNDYGAGTKSAVTAFQKAVGITADGEAGVGTFGKMIDWLKKQG